MCTILLALPIEPSIPKVLRLTQKQIALSKHYIRLQKVSHSASPLIPYSLNIVKVVIQTLNCFTWSVHNTTRLQTNTNTTFREFMNQPSAISNESYNLNKCINVCFIIIKLYRKTRTMLMTLT